MKYEYYLSIRASKDLSIYEFISTGKNGEIKKGIMFTPVEKRGVYNLAFGNMEASGEIDDQTISDNGDRDKTRLYRMAVGLNLTELSAKFEIFAEVEEGGGFENSTVFSNFKFNFRAMKKATKKDNGFW